DGRAYDHHAREPPPVRVRTSQRLLREAFVLGDFFVADLLLDYRGRASNPLWRMYRCLILGFTRCQLRCSCLAGSSATK
ncbi:unnamed protein product, partial [Polarella glacialis]